MWRVALANLEYGGIDRLTGSDANQRKTIEAIKGYEADVVLIQELWSPSPSAITGELRKIADELGMVATLGPITPGARSPLHIAVLVDTEALGAEIVEYEPIPGQVTSSGTGPAWCRVRVRLHDGREVDWASVHLPARSGTMQKAHAESLANFLTEKGKISFVGGDFNGFPAEPKLSTEELETLPRHLRVTRCKTVNGRLAMDLDVHETFERGDLVDLAASLLPEQRDPKDLRPTGEGGGRVDRLYGPPGSAVRSWQFTIGSDHDGLMFEIDPSRIGG